MNNRPIILLAVAQTLAWASLYYLFPALLLHWETALGWSRVELTSAITLAVFISALVSPLAGRLIDLHQGPLLMTGSTVVGGLCLLALAEVTALWQFYTVWGVIGVMLAGCLYDPCFALITRAHGARAKHAIILVTLIAGFASSISFPLSHLLVEAVGWRSTVRMFAAMAILVAAPLMWLGARRVNRCTERGAAETHRRQPGRSRLWPVFSPNAVFWCLGLSFAMMALSHGVVLHHLLPLLDERGIAAGVAILAVSLIGPMQVVGRLVILAAERYVSNAAITIGCFAVVGLSVLLLSAATADRPALLLGFVVLFGGGYGVVSIIRPLIARDVLGADNFGDKTGALALLYLAGVAAAPYFGSLVWRLGGYRLLLWVLVVLLAVGQGLCLAAHRRARRSDQSSG